MNEPITYDWLRANGFRLQVRKERQPTDHVRRCVGHEFHGGRQFMGSHDDLCIEFAEASGGNWHCWILQVEPRRHIHVRMMRERWEVQRLYEGLTGRRWGTANT